MFPVYHYYRAGGPPKLYYKGVYRILLSLLLTSVLIEAGKRTDQQQHKHKYSYRYSKEKSKDR